MKKMIFGLLALATLSVQAANLDVAKSKITWIGKKAVVDSKHLGTVKIKEGKFTMKDGKLTGGEVSVDMTTITTTDLSGEWKTKLETHLKSADFFKVGQYPTTSFKATSVKSAGKGNYKVLGELTIVNVKKSVELVLTEKGKVYSGKLVIDRTKWGLKYGSGSFFDNLGDKAIANDIALDFKFVLK